MVHALAWTACPAMRSQPTQVSTKHAHGVSATALIHVLTMEVSITSTWLGLPQGSKAPLVSQG